MADRPPVYAVIFDLDGVLTDTAELHFLSWKTIADELDIPFDRERNHALRGLSRPDSLEVLLGDRSGEFSTDQKAEILERKNDDYLARVERLSERDLEPGAADLLHALRASGFALALASGSKNARVVMGRLGIDQRFDVIVDGNDLTRSKPDPQVFELAAEQLRQEPAHCVVVEDAESGVAAARAAGMRVVGIGDAARLAAADRVVPGVAALSVEAILEL